MRFLIGLLTILMSFSVLAAEVPGQIFYKKKDGVVARRDVTLEVPSMGKGEVVLKGKSFEWRTEDFWSNVSDSGEVIFTAAFKTEFMGMKSTIAFEGTYLRGSNEIIYNGNFFKKNGHDPVAKDLAGFDYNGGFTFNYMRTK